MLIFLFKFVHIWFITNIYSLDLLLVFIYYLFISLDNLLKSLEKNQLLYSYTQTAHLTEQNGRENVEKENVR